MNDHTKHYFDLAAVVAAFTAFFEVIAPIAATVAAILSSIWTLMRIIETAPKWWRKLKERFNGQGEA